MPYYFPHLDGGLSAQYPVRRVTRYRTVVNTEDLTTSLRAADPNERRLAWWLRYQGLTDGEAASLGNFFRAVKGPIESFVYLDPEANLLVHSEALEEAAWWKSAGLSIELSGTPPPEASGAFRLTATSGQTAEIRQTIAAAASHRWMFSVYARSAAGGTVSMFLRTSGGEQSAERPLDSQWKRLSFGGRFWSSGEGLEAGLRLAGGASAEVTGFQLDNQCAPSRYKRNGAHGGVHSEARFSQDSLRITAIAPNRHQAAMIVTAPLPA